MRWQGALGRVFVNGEGTLRSGWALGVFAVAAIVAISVLGLLAVLLGGRPLLANVVLDDPALITGSLARLGAVVAAAWAGESVVRQRFGASGLVDPRAAPRFGLGFLGGMGAISVSVGAAWALGFESFTGTTHAPGTLLRSGLALFAVLGPASAAEEIALRGFVLQQLARAIGGWVRPRLSGSADPERAALRTGRWAAVGITSAVFGLAHRGNPNISDLAVVNIVLVGLWFGAVTLRTGSLWMPMGLHAGWNWFQGFFWGEPVSGLFAGASLLRRGPHAGGILSGGAFGPEASVVTAFVLVLLLAVTLAWKPPGHAITNPNA